MSHWNHRVVRRVFEHPDGTREEQLGIHEAYYDDNGKIWAVTQEPVAPVSDATEPGGLIEVLERMLRACSKATLDYDEIPEDGAINPSDEPAGSGWQVEPAE